MKTRLLGLDYGHVRIGLAVSDRDRIISSPLTTYHRVDEARDREFFQQILEKEDIGALVLGLPIHLSGIVGGKALETQRFGRWLVGLSRLPLFYWDERFSTLEAENYLLAAGLTKKKRKQRKDTLAAQIILQSFLDAGCPETYVPDSLEGNR